MSDLVLEAERKKEMGDGQADVKGDAGHAAKRRYMETFAAALKDPDMDRRFVHRCVGLAFGCRPYLETVVVMLCRF